MKERARLRVPEPPREMEPPPERPEPAVTVREEFCRLVLETTPVPVMPAKLMLPERESEVPWALVKEKFWSEDEAVVEVAKILPVPRMGASRPPEKVVVAEEVEVRYPTVSGKNESAFCLAFQVAALEM